MRRADQPPDRGLMSTGGDEAVAPARHGLDEGRRRRIVIERATNLQDDPLEHTLADVGLGPPGAQQVILRDELPAVSTKRRRIPNAFGVRATSSSPHQSCSVARSRKKLRTSGVDPLPSWLWNRFLTAF